MIANKYPFTVKWHKHIQTWGMRVLGMLASNDTARKKSSWIALGFAIVLGLVLFHGPSDQEGSGSAVSARSPLLSSTVSIAESISPNIASSNSANDTLRLLVHDQSQGKSMPWSSR
jgi:hypothetical protein